jgi:hypothetical protein
LCAHILRKRYSTRAGVFNPLHRSLDKDWFAATSANRNYNAAPVSLALQVSVALQVLAMRLNSVLLRSTVVAALGGLLFGFDTVVISGTTQALTELFHLSPDALGLTVASALLGTIIGSLLAGIPGDRLGRRDSLRILAILYFVSAIGCGFAWNWTALVAFRVIGGLAIGGSSVLGPMYIAEIAPAKYRGRLVGLFQFNGLRNPAGIPVQLLDRDVEPGRHRMAMEAGHRGLAGSIFSDDALRHSAQPALAGEERPHRRSAPGAASPARRTTNRSYRISSRPSMPNITPANPSSTASTGFRYSWRCPSPCSINSPASTRFFITSTRFSRRRASTRFRPICSRLR